MAKGMSMKVLLQLQTKEFQNGLRGIQRQLNGFKNFMKSAFALGSITMFGRQMVQVGKDFENAMARVKAVSNATQEEFRKMQAEAERLGSTTRYTATEAAEALENLTRNGMSAAAATKSLSSVLQLAQANAITLADAANIVTNTLNMFNLSIEQAGRVNDVLSSTASHAATDITSLYEAMTNAAPAANVLGFSIEEVSSAIGALAQRGVKGAEAGTKLRIAFQKMADPKVIGKMKDLGIDVDETTMKAEGLRATIEKIAKANLSLGQLGKVFDAKSAMAIQQLVASLDDLDYMLDVTANSAGETERMFNQGVGTVQKELDTLKSKYEGLLITISNKTSGAVKGVVKLLQNLIGNFETVGGTIANIASVAVPLLTKRVIALGKTIQTMFTQAAAGAATMKAAMGGIVTIVATLVTWVGTALVGAWNRAHKEMREANAKMAEAKANVERLQESVKKLTEKIGDGSDSSSLNSAIKEATKLFPEFADAINNAKRIAAATGEWDRLKTLLQDIADLQQIVIEREAKTAVANAKARKIGNQMYNDASPMNMFNVHYKEFAAATIKEQFKGMGFTNDEVRDKMTEIAKILGSTPSGVDVVKEVEKYLDSYEIKVNETLLADWLDKYTDTGYFTKDFDEKARKRGGTESLQQTNKDIHALDSLESAKSYDIAKQAFDDEKHLLDDSLKKREISQNEYQQKMYDAAQKFYDKSLELDNLSPEKKKEAESIRDLYPMPKQRGNTSGGGGSSSSSASKVKTDTDVVKDAIDDYDKELKKLDNRLAAGTITQENYDAEIKKLTDNTWEAITAVSGFSDILANIGKGEFGNALGSKYAENRAEENTEKLIDAYGELAKFLVPAKPNRDTRDDWKKSQSDIDQENIKIEFDYADSLDKLVADLTEALESGKFDPIKGDALEILQQLIDKAKEARDTAEGLQEKLDFSEIIAKLDEQIKDLESTAFETFESVASAMDRIMDGLLAIASVFDEDLKDSPFFQAFEAFGSVLNSGIQIIQGMIAALQLIQQVQSKKAKEKVKNNLLEMASDKLAEKAAKDKAKAEAQEAVAGGAASVADIPYVGPVLAVAAAASIIAALMAGFSKFAKGGIVGGSKSSGDQNVIRANSGEMVLTKGQQASLWRAVSSGHLGGNGNVQFTIRGEDLVGTLNNYNRLRR